MSCDSSGPSSSRGKYPADEAKQTATDPEVTIGANASRSRTVPIRLTSTIRRGSAIVGDNPAAWANDRNGPSS